MQLILQLIRRCWYNDQGGEMLEYALVSGLVVIAALSVIGSIGTKVLAKWTSLNNAM